MDKSAANAPYGKYVPAGRSAVAQRAAALPPTIRHALGVNDYLVALIDGLVTVASIVLESSETPLLSRLADAREEFAFLGEGAEWIAAALAELQADDVVARWGRQLQRADRQKFLNRFLGTARFNSFMADLHEDARIVLAAILVGVSALRPWSLALDDAFATLTPKQRDEIGFDAGLGASLFKLVLDAEGVIGISLGPERGVKVPPNLGTFSASAEEVSGAMAQGREILTNKTDETLLGLRAIFMRKIQGARDALEHSADGVSQAANSLVELIDRFSREAFEEREVLDWLAASGLGGQDFTFLTADGRKRPTKRAELLCLSWAGVPARARPEGSIDFQKLSAFTLLNLRTELQKFKHADEATEEEKVRLDEFLNAIEASVLLMVRVAWMLAGPEPRQMLLDRLGRT